MKERKTIFTYIYRGYFCLFFALSRNKNLKKRKEKNAQIVSFYTLLVTTIQYYVKLL